MPRHRFRIGQFVDFAPSRLAMPSSGGEYKVIRLLPLEGGDLLYRIKSSAETFERVAKESELAPSVRLH